ncbi:hypothetical protein Scep_027622 [Stephania cephalantha]|uniref:Uncharacterized protein n=1 Tax=Stephania cephalantha TaxID=152367 RepID=A0AAP0E898_9MAGN
MLLMTHKTYWMIGQSLKPIPFAIDPHNRMLRRNWTHLLLFEVYHFSKISMRNSSMISITIRRTQQQLQKPALRLLQLATMTGASNDSQLWSKAAPWHEQGIPWQGLTKLDLGVDQVKVRLVSFLDVSYWSWGNGLTSTIRRGVFSPRGGTGIVARKTLEHALGTMPR